MGRLLVVAGIGIVAFAAVTWWALEWDGVMIVTTRASDGSERETHIWYVYEGDRLWLEAGLPENPWYQDIVRDPRVTLTADHVSGEFVLASVPGREAAAHVRSLLREKYGLRDRWVLFFVDASRTTAVLAKPVEEVTGSQP